MTKVIIHRIIAVLGVPKHNADEIKYGQTVFAAMSGNTNFPNPNQLLAAFSTALTKYDAAETATKTRAKGTIPVRNAARATFFVTLHALRAQVQGVADADQENAEAIITSAAMNVKKTATPQARTFGARQRGVSGEVELTNKAAAPRAAYDWQYSLDGGKTWIDAPSTLQSKTTISGLPVATTVLFRGRALTKTGKSDWTQPTSLVIK